MPWLTGDNTATDFICRRVVIPNDIALIMAVNGALLDLVKPRNWEQHGAATPDETAALMQTMFLDYQDSECAEPMTSLTIQAGVFKYEVAQGQKQPQPNDDEWWPLSNVAVVWNGVATGLDGSGGIALPAGTYLMNGMHTIFEAEACRLSWWNKSTNVMLVNGLSMNNGASDNGQAVVHVMSIFQSAGELFDMRIWVNRTDSNALGLPANFSGMPEVYGLVNIIKLNYDL